MQDGSLGLPPQKPSSQPTPKAFEAGRLRGRRKWSSTPSARTAGALPWEQLTAIPAQSKLETPSLSWQAAQPGSEIPGQASAQFEQLETQSDAWLERCSTWNQKPLNRSILAGARHRLSQRYAIGLNGLGGGFLKEPFAPSPLSEMAEHHLQSLNQQSQGAWGEHLKAIKEGQVAPESVMASRSLMASLSAQSDGALLPEADLAALTPKDKSGLEVSEARLALSASTELAQMHERSYVGAPEERQEMTQLAEDLSVHLTEASVQLGRHLATASLPAHLETSRRRVLQRLSTASEASLQPSEPGGSPLKELGKHALGLIPSSLGALASKVGAVPWAVAKGALTGVYGLWAVGLVGAVGLVVTGGIWLAQRIKNWGKPKLPA